MEETKINISELKSEGSDIIKELTEFLKEKTNAEIETTGDALTVKGEGKGVSRKYLRVLLKKFLHKKELKDTFRLIADKKSALMIKERKIVEEEE